MNTIVIDLEFCNIGRKNKEIRNICRHEVIQIGAVKLDTDLEVIDRFDQLVRPEYGHIDHRVESLTKITEHMVMKGIPYQQAMNLFLEWVGEDSEAIGSWSMEDFDQIVRENELKKYKNDRLDILLQNWFDIQKLFDTKLGLTQQISLHNAMKGAGITFIGQEHSAVDDAENTAYLYQMMKDEKKFKKKMQPLIDIMTPTESLSFSLESLVQGALKQFEE